MTAAVRIECYGKTRYLYFVSPPSKRHWLTMVNRNYNNCLNLNNGHDLILINAKLRRVLSFAFSEPPQKKKVKGYFLEKKKVTSNSHWRILRHEFKT